MEAPGAEVVVSSAVAAAGASCVSEAKDSSPSLFATLSWASWPGVLPSQHGCAQIATRNLQRVLDIGSDVLGRRTGGSGGSLGLGFGLALSTFLGHNVCGC